MPRAAPIPVPVSTRSPVACSRRTALACATLGLVGELRAEDKPRDEPAAVRVALVVGNGAYPQSMLRNPVRDAQAVGEALQRLGFQVVVVHDGTRAQMQQALARVGAALRGRQGIGLLYYAGHGVQLDWRNYMLPVDASPQTAADIPGQTIDVQEVLELFQRSGTRVNIVVLDACRDNPFGTAGGPRGLAPMDAPPGTLLAYATAPGNVAADGDAASGHGLYTRYLVQELQQPGTAIEALFKRVRFQVRRDSDGRQIPWESTSLEDDFFFTAAPLQTDAARERAEDAADADTQAEAKEWAGLAKRDSARDIADFLVRHPSSPLVEQAQFRLDQLQRQRPIAQQARRAAKTAAPGVWRYQVGDRFDYRLSGEALHPSLALQRGHWRLTVTAAGAERVEFNQGRVVTDQMGTSLVEAGVRKVPGHVKVPSELHVGKTWQTRYEVHDLAGDTLRARMRWRYRVVALEPLQVEAGAFSAWHIVGRGADALSTDDEPKLPRSRASRTHELWVDSATLVVLKESLHSVLRGRSLRAEERELTAMRRAPRPPSNG